MVKNFPSGWTLWPWSNQPLNNQPMKLKKNKLQRPLPGLLAALALWAFYSTAADQPDKAASHRSVFVLPTNPNDGRDPLFPDSLRPYESAVVVVTNHTAEITSLIFKGVSGPPGHQLVVINNHTFGAGDEGD